MPAFSAAALLGALTWRRNAQYQTGIAIWQDTVNQRRDNPRAWNNLADALINAGDYERGAPAAATRRSG